MDSIKYDLTEKGLSSEDPYNQAAWRRLSETWTSYKRGKICIYDTVSTQTLV